MKFVKLTLNILSAIACVVLVIVALQGDPARRYAEQLEVTNYTQWMNDMIGAKYALATQGPNETPRGMGANYMNPNMAMIDADLWLKKAASFAEGVSFATRGYSAQVFGRLAAIALTASAELEMLTDKGGYLGDVFEFTMPIRTQIANREFMYHQVADIVLGGMPNTVSTVKQIDAVYRHIDALGSGNPTNFGTFSADFAKHMRRQGEIR